MSWLKDLREKPESSKKKILWVSVFFVAAILVLALFFQLKYDFSRINFSDFSGPNINKEDFREEFNDTMNRLKKQSNETKEEMENNK